MVCIQETKLEAIDEFGCRYLWGSDEVDYSYRLFIGASRGLLSLRDINEEEMNIFMSCEKFLITKGRYIKSWHEFAIANVFSPCDSDCQESLRNYLRVLIYDDEGNA